MSMDPLVLAAFNATMSTAGTALKLASETQSLIHAEVQAMLDVLLVFAALIVVMFIFLVYKMKQFSLVAKQLRLGAHSRQREDDNKEN